MSDFTSLPHGGVVPARVSGRLTVLLDIVVRSFRGGVLRCDSVHHPEFWLEINTYDDTAQGRLPGIDTIPGGCFVVRRVGTDTFRVDHTTNLWFWLEITRTTK